MRPPSERYRASKAPEVLVMLACDVWSELGLYIRPYRTREREIYRERAIYRERDREGLIEPYKAM